MAKNLLASMYEQGLGVKKDPAKALEFYLASAKLGNGLAQNRLGNIYQKHKKYEAAAYNFNKALAINSMSAVLHTFIGLTLHN